jgi:Ca2+-binding EF-hand superfamily protein
MERAQWARASVVAAVAIAHGLALAGCQSGLSLSGAPAQPQPGALPFIAEFKKIDAAGKGRITMEQATSYYAALFVQLDKNGDGLLDANELEAMLPAMDAKSGMELLQKLDRNSDGRLSRSEFQIIANWLFQVARSPNELALGDIEKPS